MPQMRHALALLGLSAIALSMPQRTVAQSGPGVGLPHLPGSYALARYQIEYNNGYVTDETPSLSGGAFVIAVDSTFSQKLEPRDSDPIKLFGRITQLKAEDGGARGKVTLRAGLDGRARAAVFTYEKRGDTLVTMTDVSAGADPIGVGYLEKEFWVPNVLRP